MDLEHANVFLENSETNFSSSLFAQRKLTISRSVSAKDSFDFDSLSSFQSPLALDNAGPWVSRVPSQPDSPDVFIVRPNLELFSISSRTPFLELSAADRADQASSRTLTAKVQLPQEVPPEPPPLKLCSFLALPSPCVMFSLLNFVTLKQLPIVSCSDNNMNMENSAADPLFCETFVTAPTETVGVFFVLQRNLDFTAAVKSVPFVQNEFTMLYKPCISNGTDALVFSQPSGFLSSIASLLLCCLVLTVGSLVQCCFSKFVDVSLNNSWITDMCSLFRDGGGKASERCFLSCALGAVSCSTAPNCLFPLGTVFREVRRDFRSPLQYAVNRDRLPCALASCSDAAQPP